MILEKQHGASEGRGLSRIIGEDTAKLWLGCRLPSAVELSDDSGAHEP